MSLTASYVTTALRTSLPGNMSRLLTICLVAVAAVGPVLVASDHPQYAYDYSVNDPHTGDNKAQWETRHGDAVKGSYSLVEPDGSLRVVDYHADDHSGFHADVKHLGPNLHPAPLVTKIGLPHGPLHLPTLTPIAPYGFGPAPHAIGLPKTTFGHWNLPWDPLTSSYGGWVPLGYHGLPVYGPHATIYSKKWKNGKLYKWVTGPIPLTGRKLIIRTTKKH